MPAGNDDYEALLREVNASLGGQPAREPAPTRPGKVSQRTGVEPAKRGGGMTKAVAVATPAAVAAGMIFALLAVVLPFFGFITTGLTAFAATWVAVVIEEMRHK